MPPIHTHGKIRGLSDSEVPSSPLFEGRFGRMFRSLAPAEYITADATSLENLRKLAIKMTAQPETTPTPETARDDEENVGTPIDRGIGAGYTYLGQFIDHDLTFDPASSLDRLNDPDALVNFRTPRFDLDSVYGRGPDDQPYLYDVDNTSDPKRSKKKLLLGRELTGNPKDLNTRDLQRNANDRAIIGDPRNDENVIVSGLQATFIRFHNHMVDVMKDASFEEIQQAVRWHYQWVVLHDFLPTIIGKKMVDQILPHLAKPNGSIYVNKPDFRFYKWHENPFLPVEFSVAAYRFGHSMVRPIYRLNTTLPNRQTIFDVDPAHPNPFLTLEGFRAFPSSWAIDWDLFFPTDAPIIPSGPTRLQWAYKIDTSLVSPLGNLPASVAAVIPSLAERNLRRGLQMGLPSGQDVARFMDVPVIPDKNLRVGKATEDDTKTNPRLVDISPVFEDNAPLWYYILAEAQQSFKNNNTAIRLGEVGGRIVGEVFIHLLLGDGQSFLSQNPSWKPLKELASPTGKFGIVELIAAARKPA